MSDRTAHLVCFERVLDAEREVVAARRAMIASEGDTRRDPASRAAFRNAPSARIEMRRQAPTPGDTPKPRAGFREDAQVVGLALSGGGVRSASICLGVLQAIDACCPKDKPQLLDRIDYLSTVSGGGYIGAALVNGLKERNGGFPFASRLDRGETIETQHLRDYSNYLMPQGLSDIVIGLLAVSRGILVNAVVFLGAILFASAVTVYLNPSRSDLADPALAQRAGTFLAGLFGAPAPKFEGVLAFFPWSGFGGIALVTIAMILVLLNGSTQRLRAHEQINRVHFWLFVIWSIVFALEAQVYVLDGIFRVSECRTAKEACDGNLVASLLAGLRDWFGKGLWAVLAALVGLLASVGKLDATLKALVSDRSWSGSMARWAAKLGLYIAALIVPFLLWASYLAFSFWGIASSKDASSYTHAHVFLIVGLALLVLSLFVRPNAGSLHIYYRDRLSRAFLWDLAKLQRAKDEKRRVVSTTKADRLKLHELKKRGRAEGRHPGPWLPCVRFAPYLLINTAVNLEGSPDLNRRGRNADSFIFSPLHIGSEATGYASSLHVAALDPRVNLATAMATSGAAASANMGASTIPVLTFSLSALNIRLGYWLPNPRLPRVPLGARIGVWYFVREAFGLIDETSRNVYLTDGGHYDNLGIYELMKRRCKVIIAVDAEADPTMNFDSLVRLQRYARIDLGALIDLPWAALKCHALAITADATRGPDEPSFARNGPHVVLGRILYRNAQADTDPREETGLLIYVKASLSGDESDLIRDYKRRNAEFPHETTLDQFFSEEQFEVYRSLGFHMAQRFLSGEDKVAGLDPDCSPGWLRELERALESLSFDPAAIERILRRAESPAQNHVRP